MNSDFIKVERDVLNNMQVPIGSKTIRYQNSVNTDLNARVQYVSKILGHDEVRLPVENAQHSTNRLLITVKASDLSKALGVEKDFLQTLIDKQLLSKVIKSKNDLLRKGGSKEDGFLPANAGERSAGFPKIEGRTSYEYLPESMGHDKIKIGDEIYQARKIAKAIGVSKEVLRNYVKAGLLQELLRDVSENQKFSKEIEAAYQLLEECQKNIRGWGAAGEIPSSLGKLFDDKVHNPDDFFRRILHEDNRPHLEIFLSDPVLAQFLCKKCRDSSMLKAYQVFFSRQIVEEHGQILGRIKSMPLGRLLDINYQLFFQIQVKILDPLGMDLFGLLENHEACEELSKVPEFKSFLEFLKSPDGQKFREEVKEEAQAKSSSRQTNEDSPPKPVQKSEWVCPPELKNDESEAGQILKRILKAAHDYSAIFRTDMQNFASVDKSEIKRIICEMLDIRDTSNEKEIKRAYFGCARIIHPDKCKGNPFAVEAFQNLSNTLSALEIT